jgi:hypothetical protein
MKGSKKHGITILSCWDRSKSKAIVDINERLGIRIDMDFDIDLEMRLHVIVLPYPQAYLSTSAQVGGASPSCEFKDTSMVYILD